MSFLTGTLVRYRSVVELVETYRAYAGGKPSRVRAWSHVARLLAAPRKTVLCHPQRPGGFSVLHKLCAVAGYGITTDPNRPHDVAFAWEDATHVGPPAFRGGAAAVNGRCLDISKRHVARTFADVFGYGLEVDPTAYRGAVVKKSDENGTHDGEVIECPIPASAVEPGFVYQKAVDNRRDDGPGFYEYRVPVFGRSIPVVYVKYRPADAPFKEFDGAEVVAPDAVLSADERGRLLDLAAALGVDYGELDVLRDRGDGRAYVVDANKTPSGPRRGFDPEQQVAALAALRPAFEALVAGAAAPPAPARRPATPSGPSAAPPAPALARTAPPGRGGVADPTGP